MALSAKTIRTQLARLQPLLQGRSLETVRRGQNKVGELMEAKYRSQVITKPHTFASFSGGWVVPRDERRQGVVLYLQPPQR